MRFWKKLAAHFLPSRDNAYRPHMLRKPALFALLAVALVAEGALVFNLVIREGGGTFVAAVVQSEVIALTNTERAQNKVAKLAENALLDASAQAKADDMAAKGYFSHNGPDGKQPWAWIESQGYDYQYAGENLAVRFVDSKDVVLAWMASPTHRANIVKGAYTEVGVGIAQGMYKGKSATFVVQHFARPSAEYAVARLHGAVLGAETGPSPSFGDSLARTLGKLISEPRESTAWILGSIITLLCFALAFTFFHHIQLQPRDLLVPGTLVVGVALFLLVINTNFLSATVTAGADGAAAVGLTHNTVILTSEAYSFEK